MARQRFGKYEVLARLATGGAASIFLARQPGVAGFNKLVVLKTLLPERASDEDFVRMFLDEARLAARLHHPNCVQIYDLGRVEQIYYISMEYIFGETLWNLLTTVTRLKTPLPVTHVAAIIAHVCEGLHHAHELKDKNGRDLNLVHRDVSPQNVMISFEGQTKVVDFGIAKAETDRPPTVAGIVKGKFSYMSPEQITGNPVDRRSDIYSLGIVMFECLASRRLYRGDTPEEIARLILEHRAPRLRDVVPEIPQALDDICARALARQPTRRFQNAHAMGAAIRDYLESVRFSGNATVISRLMGDRFGDLVDRRRDAYDAALVGDYDEAELCEALGASPVRQVDLFSDDGGVSGIRTNSAAGRMVDAPEVAETMPEVRTPPSSSGQFRRRPGATGWQATIAPSRSASVPGPVPGPERPTEMVPPRNEHRSSRVAHPVQAAAEARTRVDGDRIGLEPGLEPSPVPGWENISSGVSPEDTGPTRASLSSLNDPFHESTPFDEMAQGLDIHPDAEADLSR
ncbi:MAG: serine/threonine-protein kinase, partial [Myxococcota bacterium]